MAFDGFGGLNCGLVVLAVAGRAPWGTPYHQIFFIFVGSFGGFLAVGTPCRFAKMPSPTPLRYPLPFPSDFLQFPAGTPCRFPKAPSTLSLFPSGLPFQGIVGQEKAVSLTAIPCRMHRISSDLRS